MKLGNKLYKKYKIVYCIIGTLFFLGCETPTEPIKEEIPYTLNREVRCRLQVIPDLPVECESCGIYRYTVPIGHWSTDTLRISYQAPAESIVQWIVNWPINGYDQSIVTYTDEDCRGEVSIIILPNFVNWFAMIEASVEGYTESIIVLIVRPTFSSSWIER
jgi:hypothetical protein